jgi:hypothetical protein
LLDVTGALIAVPDGWLTTRASEPVKVSLENTWITCEGIFDCQDPRQPWQRGL